MADRIIREGIRLLLATEDAGVLYREQILAVMGLLANTTTYTVTGMERRISEWNNEDGQGNYLHNTDFDFVNASVNSLKELDEQLGNFSLPPLKEWEDIWSEEPGYYATAIIEDDNGARDEHGNYIVDYTIKVEFTFSTPLMPEDFPADSRRNPEWPRFSRIGPGNYKTEALGHIWNVGKMWDHPPPNWYWERDDYIETGDEMQKINFWQWTKRAAVEDLKRHLKQQAQSG